MVDGYTWEKGSEICRENDPFQEWAGKVQDEPGHLVVTDVRKCSMNNGDMSKSV